MRGITFYKQVLLKLTPEERLALDWYHIEYGYQLTLGDPLDRVLSKILSNDVFWVRNGAKYLILEIINDLMSSDGAPHKMKVSFQHLVSHGYAYKHRGGWIICYEDILRDYLSSKNAGYYKEDFND